MAGRVSQEVVEAEVTGTPNARVSQVAVEAEVTGKPLARISQQVVEALANYANNARISQIVIECLVPNLEYDVLPVYPTLPGLTFSVHWKTSFSNAPTQTAASGAQIDLGLGQYPTHDFELTYDVLRNTFGFQEEKLLRGFFGRAAGNLGRFVFKFDKDSQVKSQVIGTTDGASHLWTLVRTYGVGEDSFTEPVGYVDLTCPFNLYLNGSLQDTSTYSVQTTVPGLQQVQFVGIPTTGQTITVDMDYFYYCKFPDAGQAFEQFMNNLWSADKVTLHTCLAGG